MIAFIQMPLVHQSSYLLTLHSLKYWQCCKVNPKQRHIQASLSSENAAKLLESVTENPKHIFEAQEIIQCI
jgi:hypothetical protein